MRTLRFVRQIVSLVLAATPVAIVAVLEAVAAVLKYFTRFIMHTVGGVPRAAGIRPLPLPPHGGRWKKKAVRS